MTLISIGSALLLTEVIEFITAYILGYRGKEFYKTLALINILTNPLLNYIIQVLFFFKLLYFRFPIVILLEVFVVIAEWRIFYYVFSKESKSYLGLSVIINASSFLIGLLIFG